MSHFVIKWLLLPYREIADFQLKALHFSGVRFNCEKSKINAFISGVVSQFGETIEEFSLTKSSIRSEKGGVDPIGDFFDITINAAKLPKLKQLTLSNPMNGVGLFFDGEMPNLEESKIGRSTDKRKIKTNFTSARMKKIYINFDDQLQDVLQEIHESVEEITLDIGRSKISEFSY